MNETTDPLTVLKTLRPTPPLDGDWSVAELSRITTSPTTRPAAQQPIQRRRRRIVVSSAVAGALFAGGIGTAAATGLLPDRLLNLLDTMSPSPDAAHQTASATVQRAATAPGPDGQVFSVVTWDEGPGSDYEWCSVPVIETAASAAEPVPADFYDNGAVCGPGGFADEFAAEYGVNASDPYAVFEVKAGTAVRGELRLPDGSTYPAVLVRGWLYGWFPPATEGVLTGYTQDGTVAGTVTLQPQR